MRRKKIHRGFYSSEGMVSPCPSVVQMLVLGKAWSRLSWDRLLELHWPFVGGRWWEGLCGSEAEPQFSSLSSVLVRKPQLAFSQKLLWTDLMIMYVAMGMISSHCKMGKALHSPPFPDILRNKECSWVCVCTCIRVYLCVREL